MVPAVERGAIAVHMEEEEPTQEAGEQQRDDQKEGKVQPGALEAGKKKKNSLRSTHLHLPLNTRTTGSGQIKTPPGGRRIRT